MIQLSFRSRPASYPIKAHLLIKNSQGSNARIDATPSLTYLLLAETGSRA